MSELEQLQHSVSRARQLLKDAETKGDRREIRFYSQFITNNEPRLKELEHLSKVTQLTLF